MVAQTCRPIAEHFSGALQRQLDLFGQLVVPVAPDIQHSHLATGGAEVAGNPVDHAGGYVLDFRLDGVGEAATDDFGEGVGERAWVFPVAEGSQLFHRFIERVVQVAQGAIKHFSRIALLKIRLDILALFQQLGQGLFERACGLLAFGLVLFQHAQCQVDLRQ